MHNHNPGVTYSAKSQTVNTGLMPADNRPSVINAEPTPPGKHPTLGKIYAKAAQQALPQAALQTLKNFARRASYPVITFLNDYSIAGYKADFKMLIAANRLGRSLASKLMSALNITARKAPTTRLAGGVATAFTAIPAAVISTPYALFCAAGKLLKGSSIGTAIKESDSQSLINLAAAQTESVNKVRLRCMSSFYQQVMDGQPLSSGVEMKDLSSR